MRLQALNDRVIVKVEPVPERSIVTLTNKDDTITCRTGIILSVGPAANEHNEGLIQAGLRVHFNKYSGLEVDPNDESIKAIAAGELLAIDAVADADSVEPAGVAGVVPN